MMKLILFFFLAVVALVSAGATGEGPEVYSAVTTKQVHSPWATSSSSRFQSFNDYTYVSPVVAAAPAVAYAAPAFSAYAAPAFSSYAAPAISSYAAPAISYAAPAVSYPAKLVSAPSVSAFASPALYSSYTSGYGSGYGPGYGYGNGYGYGYH